MSWQLVYRSIVAQALAAQPVRYRNGYRQGAFAPSRLIIYGEDDGVLSLRDFDPTFAYHELEWMLDGTPDLSSASPLVARIWAPWADDQGRVADTYHAAFRRLRTHVLPALRRCIATGEADSGLMISTWQHEAIDAVRPPHIRPCHGTVLQLHPRPEGYLDAYAYQRSADLGVGVPSNVAFYTRLLERVAAEVGLARGTLVYQLGDAHLYDDQLDAARELVQAQPGDRAHIRFPKARL